MPLSELDIPKLKLKGMDLINSERLDEARNLFTRIYMLNKNDFDVNMTLGIIYGMLDNYSDAEKYLRNAIAIDPNHPGPYYNLGISLKNSDDMEGAVECYTKATQLDPNNAACQNNLGSIYLQQRELDKAITCFNKAIELLPDTEEYYYNLGNALRMRGLRTDACNALEHALRLKPGYTPALKDIGQVYLSLGFPEKAEKCFRQILDENAGDLDAISGISSVFARKRDFIRALSVLEPFLRNTPVSASIALAYARVCKNTGREDDAIKLLDALLESKNLSKDSLAQIHFLLGYFYDKSKRYRKAFKHFQKGNDLRRPAEEPRDYSDTVTNISSSFSSQFMKEYDRSDTISELPIFIIGMPRSGTSLVEHILASHPDVHGGGELDTLPGLLNIISSSTNTEGLSGLTPDICNKNLLNNISTRYLDSIKRLDPSATRITDKMPGNFLNLGIIELLFPKARVIHCKREPLDTCLSCYFQDFDGHQYSTDLRTLSSFYLQYERLMKHWEEVLTIKTHCVPYEDLVTNFEGTCKNIIKFCGLDWDESCLDFYRSDRQVLTASIDQVNKPVYTDSVGRWKYYEEYIGELKSALSAGITE